MSLIDQLEKRTATIAIVGLGYVGLLLVFAYAKAGCRTLGFDVDGKKIESLSSGHSYIEHISHDDVATAQDSSQLECSTDFSRVAEVNALILCVPTTALSIWTNSLSGLPKCRYQKCNETFLSSRKSCKSLNRCASWVLTPPTAST